jgi:HEAT repeat protein
MSAGQSATLVEFARACKTAVRSVALYPATHPAIRGALTRVVAAAARLASDGDVTVMVRPDLLVLEGRAPVRVDSAIVELAALLHERLVGSVTIRREADEEDWHALLLLLSRTPEDLIAGGGIGRAWAATGRPHFELHEIDYAEVLRERAGGRTAEWDHIIACCLHGDSTSLDERAIATLLDAIGDSARFGDLLDRFEGASSHEEVAVGTRAAALLQLLRSAVAAATGNGAAPEQSEAALETIAEAAARLTPEMMLAILAKRQSPEPLDAQLASDIVDHMNDATIASFVAGAVTSAHGATERLAQAFAALVPETDRKERLLGAAYEEAKQSETGREEGFDTLWQGAADLLTSYSDESFVSDEYARELSNARSQALEVERVSDDPPDRIEAWTTSVSDTAVRQLDLDLLLDLMRIESEPAPWEAVASIAAEEVERRTVLGDVEAAQRLVDGIVCEREPTGRPGLKERASKIADTMATSQMIRHIVLQLRATDGERAHALGRLCHTMGAGVVRPLAEALATEEDNRAIGRLRELLLGFGMAARPSVEQLKNSSNPAVRRTAIDLLRVLGGDEALPELASMLNDADPEVQRESIRAIVQIGTPKAYAILERALMAGPAARDFIVRQLLGLRDRKAIPLLCDVLHHTTPRGKLASLHADIAEALGGLSAHPESTRALRQVLYRGDWWAPGRTAALRRAAATSLRRLGSPDAIAVLQEAATRGTRRVRHAARPQAELAARREKERA